MAQNKNAASVKANNLFKGTDANFKVNINQKDFLEKKEGDIIYKKDENADFIYLILQGEVKLKISGVFSSPVIVNHVRNEYFGEKELLENTKRKSSAVANTDCLLYRLDKNSINILFYQNKVIKKNLFKSLHIEEQEEPEAVEGQKGFFIPPDESTKKFTITSIKEKVKTPDPVERSEPLENSVQAPVSIPPEDTGFEYNRISPDLTKEEEEDSLRKSKELQEKAEKDEELKWDFTSSFKEAELPEENLEVKGDIPNDYEIVPEDTSLFSTAYTQGVEKNTAAAVTQEIESESKELTREEKNKLLKTFSGFIAEDIKYPMLTLKFYAEQIKKENLSHEINEVVDLLIEQANIVSDVVETTTEFAGDTSAVNPETVNINSALDEILGLLADYVESKNSRLYKKYETTAIANVDKRKLYQAFLQIAKNACEAMPGGGNIYITAKLAGADINIEFKNNGKPIPVEMHEKIFEPYFSFEKDDAAGLGLAIADKIIKSHGGRIMIDSANADTIFIISLPAAG